jgi:hypothetical protein
MDVKRLTLVLAVALGLAVATFVGLWSSNSASAGGFEDGLKCYRVQNVETVELRRGPLIYISDQFEEKNLLVKKPISYCTRADKSVQSSGTAGDFASFRELVCYAFKDAPGQPRFRPQEILTQDQFDENFYVVTKPLSLCEPADKEFANGTSAGGPFENFAFKCYRVRRIESGDRFEKISVTLFDQFGRGGKDVRLGRPAVFCTQVEEKKSKAKNDHIENAAILERDELVHVSTISASRDRSDPEISCVGPSGTNYGHSVWYTYTPTYDQAIQIVTANSTYDTVLAIFRGDPANGDEVACDDDGGPDHTSEINTKLDNGQKYFILVAVFGGTAAGKLKLNLEVTADCSSGCAGGATAATAVDENAEGDASGLSPDWNLMCYTLSQRAPEDVRLRTTDQLTISEFDLGRGTMYCTPAGKCKLILPKSAGDASLAGENPFICRE